MKDKFHRNEYENIRKKKFDPPLVVGTRVNVEGSSEYMKSTLAKAIDIFIISFS